MYQSSTVSHMLKELSFSHVRLFATLWTVACEAPLSMGFPRQEYWSGLPLPSLGSLPDTGIKPTHRLSILVKPRSPASQADSLPSEPPGKHFNIRLRPWKTITYSFNILSQVAQWVKNPPAMQKMQETQVWSLVRKITWRRARQPTPVFLPAESDRQRSLVGYSPQGHKELDTTEATEQILSPVIVVAVPLLSRVWPHGLQHARLPCLSPSPGACSNSCPLCWWCQL